jgi:hypothetical protein
VIMSLQISPGEYILFSANIVARLRAFLKHIKWDARWFCHYRLTGEPTRGGQAVNGLNLMKAIYWRIARQIPSYSGEWAGK